LIWWTRDVPSRVRSSDVAITVKAQDSEKASTAPFKQLRHGIGASKTQVGESGLRLNSIGIAARDDDSRRSDDEQNDSQQE
jgi:hypothetical protein